MGRRDASELSARKITLHQYVRCKFYLCLLIDITPWRLKHAGALLYLQDKASEFIRNSFDDFYNDEYELNL